ncbi:MAG: 50S ribosomal protein L17 [Planctomycetes bacterium]|nr:50S ribosomal protein L17 [Planctomycetota bacterium]
MRHRVAGRRLGRDSEHRLAMRRNMVASLFEHETISTTIEKAKEVKPFAEKLITLAKKGDLASRRRAIALLGDRSMVVEEDGDFVKKGSVISKLFSELGPRYLDRNGGYTRIIRLAMRRLGDNGQLVLLQLLGSDEKVEKTKKAKKAKKKVEAVVEEEPVEVVEEQPQETPDEQDQPEQTEEVAETAKDVQDESKQ